MRNKYFRLLFIAVVLFVIFGYFKLEAEKNRKKGLSKGIVEFYKTGKISIPDISAYIDAYVEEDYFSENILQNGDFSNGLSHWAIERGQKNIFKTSAKNQFLITDKEYVSTPYSLKIIAEELPCRLYYSKDKDVRPLACPHDFTQSSIWMGIRSGTVIEASLYYKGAGPTVYICLLQSEGQVKNLDMRMINETSAVWKKIEISKLIPQNGRAVALEITVNKNQPGRVLFLDDIKIKISSGEN